MAAQVEQCWGLGIVKWPLFNAPRHGKTVACIFKDGGLSGATNPTAVDFTWTCGMTHEETHSDYHFENHKCPPVGIGKAYLPVECVGGAECQAYKAEGHCPSNFGIHERNGDAQCIEQVRTELEHLERQIGRFCPH